MVNDSSTRIQKKSLFTASLAHICQDGLDASTYVLLPILASVFGLSYAQVGAVKALKSIALGLLELVSGELTERFGEARLLVAGLLIAGVGYAAVSSTGTVTGVILFLIIVGVGGGLQHAPASALVSNTYDDHNKRSALGLYNSSGDVGKLLFTGVFSLAIGASLAWQPVVLSFGIITVVSGLGIGMLMMVHRPFRKVPTNSNKTIAQNSLAPGWGVTHPAHFANLLVVVILDNAVQTGVLVFAAFLMIAKGLPLYLSTLATAMVLIGGVFGKAGCGFLAEKLGIRQSFTLVQVLTTAGLISVVAAPGWLAFLLLLPLGIVSQGSTSITYGLLPDYIHKDRMARGYAVLYSSTSIAAAAGAWLIGLAADFYDIATAFMLMAGISLLALSPLLLSREFASTSQTKPNG